MKFVKTMKSRALVLLLAWWFTLPVGSNWFNGSPTDVKDYGPFSMHVLCDKAREAFGTNQTDMRRQPTRCYER